MHITIAGEFRKQLEQSLAGRDQSVLPQSEIANNLESIGTNARESHRKEWNWKTGKDDRSKRKEADPLFPLYWFFILLNLLVSLLGIAIWVVVS